MRRSAVPGARAGTTGTEPVADVLRYAAERATRAPSVHNTQPWRFVIRGGTALELWADPARQLHVLDPRRRQLTISCGCALFNARVAVAARGHIAVVERMPAEDEPDLLARITIEAPATEWEPISVYDADIDARRTNRRGFLEEPVTAEVVYELVAAAAAEGAQALPINDPYTIAALDRLSRSADRMENTDPAYRREIRQWTTDDPNRPDGVQIASVPRVVDPSPRDPLSIRVFDVDGLGWLPSSSRSDDNQCLLLIGTTGDSALDWLRAGEAIEHVWLELTRRSYSAGPLPQIIEVTRTNKTLRSALRLTMNPHLLMRIGHAADVEPSRRRPMAEVISESD